MVSKAQAGNGWRLKRSGFAVPILVHVGTQCREGALGHAAVSALPPFEVGDREGVVRILAEIRRVVEHDERQDHLLERNLIHGDALRREMRRRIDMGPVLPDHLVISGAEAILGDGVRLVRLRIGGGREFGLAKTRPDRRFRPKTVGEIDEGFGGNDAIGASQIRLRLRRRGDRQRAKRCDQ